MGGFAFSAGDGLSFDDVGPASATHTDVALSPTPVDEQASERGWTRFSGLSGERSLLEPQTAPVAPDAASVNRIHTAATPSPVSTRQDGWLRRYQLVAVCTDLAAAGVAAFLAYMVRFMVVGTEADQATASWTYPLICYSLPVLWVVVVACNRAYEGRFVGVGPAEFQRAFRAFLYLTVLVSFASYATKTELARGFVLVALPVTVCLTVIGRYSARKALHRQRARGHASSSVIVVGGPHSIVDLVTKLRGDVHAGMRVVGACLPIELCEDPEAVRILHDAGIPILGDLDSIREVVLLARASTVAVTSSQEIGADRLRWISWQLEGMETDLVVSPGLVEIAGARLHIRPILGLPLLHVEQPQFSGPRRVLKDGIDRTVAAAVLVILAPTLLTIGVIIRLTSKGPALFKQTRVGRDGQVFTLVKFRSMTADAADRLDDLAQHDEGNGVLFKLREDPRVTRVGRVLRKYSLDELPQLLNVVSGKMSLVGPRPPLPAEVAKYEDHVRRRLLVKPGLTGLWQVSGRSDLSWDESVRLDLRYVENWSPVLDLMILWKTVRAVVHGEGAY